MSFRLTFSAWLDKKNRRNVNTLAKNVLNENYLKEESVA